ncbi:MAG: hypothetical protein ACPG77_19265, partial [Nannocystaceae bacterium]
MHRNRPTVVDRDLSNGRKSGLPLAICLLWATSCSAHADTRSPEPTLPLAAQTTPEKAAPTPPASEPTPESEPTPAPASAAAPASTAAPTREQRLAIFHGSSEDPGTEQFLGATKELEGKHYLACNEKTLQ